MALVTLWPRLGSSFDGQVPGHGQEHLVVQRLRGVLGERWELQMRVGYYGETDPRWTLHLPAEPDQVVLADDLAVLRASSDRGLRREARAYADGALLWTQDACVGPTTPWLDQSDGLLVEPCSGPVRLRALELASGRVRWESVDAALERWPSSAWAVRAQRGTIEVVVADAVLTIDPADGHVTHLEAESAISVARCGALVASQSSDGRLWLAPDGGAQLEIGRAPAGHVSCATMAPDGALVGWLRVEGHPIAPVARGESLADGIVPAGVEGAVLAVRGIGGAAAHRTWAFTTRGDGPRGVFDRHPCWAALFDPYAGSSVPWIPPHLSFDCETGEPAVDEPRP